MSWLLDTCVVSEVARTRPEPRVVVWLDAQPDESCFLSVLTVGELEKGIARLADTARRRKLERWLRVDLVERFGARLLPVDATVAAHWGALSGEGSARGVALPVVDGLIAATALVHGLVVVTRNVADFERCSATVFDPWRA